MPWETKDLSREEKKLRDLKKIYEKIDNEIERYKAAWTSNSYIDSYRTIEERDELNNARRNQSFEQFIIKKFTCKIESVDIISEEDVGKNFVDYYLTQCAN